MEAAKQAETGDPFVTITRRNLDQALLNHFSEALSTRLGRAVCELLREGLRASDFGRRVEVDFEDGSKMMFEQAVAEADDNFVGVFTEHAGYFVFDAASVASVRRYTS